MKIQRLALALAATLAFGAFAARTGAQTPPRPASIPHGGDADGAFVLPDRFSEPDGAALYKRVCASCHMPDGKGAKGAGAYPALAGNAKLEAGGYPLYVVLHGLHGMPPVGEMMTDAQVADVVNYVRTHFGNDYKDAVTADEAKATR